MSNDRSKRKVASSGRAELESGLTEYREERSVPEASDPYDEVIAGSPEKYRAWIRRIAQALPDIEPERNRMVLEWFLERVQYHQKRLQGDVLSASMSFLNGADYEKRPWEDDSRVLWEAVQYYNGTIYSLIAAALAEGNVYARQMAAKWLPKYAPDDSAIPLLLSVLNDKEAEVGWWAAVHLSRLAPETSGLVAVLVEALNGHWLSSARVCWDFDISGKGEAAEALGHLGAQGLAGVSALTAAIPELRDYDAQLAARAVWRITGAEVCLGLLTPLIPGNGVVAKVVEEINMSERGLEVKRSPEDPAHACFVARFLWRKGEDDYWKLRAPDARGAV